MKKKRFSKLIKSFDFKNLFNELGWDNFTNSFQLNINDAIYQLEGVAEKKGFVILHCSPTNNGKIPLSQVRKRIEAEIAKRYFEHLIIYINEANDHQIWQIALKEENKPKQVRDISWYKHQDTDVLFQRLKNLLFTLDEEEQITIVDVKKRISENFAQNTETVTKKFYTEFKKQHTVFLKFIDGIDDHVSDKENANKQWYASLMLNRLMFCYFIQKKGFLDQDVHYLAKKLNECKLHVGKDNFYSFYRSFLIELFHDGLGKPKEDRSKHPIDLGRVPYLNGGLFDIHELERQFDAIDISDEAFEQLFKFFDQWNWHLDNRFEATGRDINPDVIGYIFEKYINDRASMGAYYTKEDITDYIGKNTIIPFLFDETERNYKKGFNKDAELWTTLCESDDTYIYDAVKKGVPREGGLFDDLPDDIIAGFQPEFEKEIVKESSSAHLWEIKNTWNTKAPEEIALPTELYRELIERRKRYAEIKTKIEECEITQINDFITYNLNIRQFTQDFIENTTDPDFIRHFFKAIRKITILDPTCGSGAFLFAALNILEPLYEGCITRMEQFVTEEKGKHKFFEDTLSEINTNEHPNLQYYIFKNIILNNLHGVDIMNEAVEIAKLRLFLKLVATVDVNPRKDNFGLEPLPDIDFNIRAGNTLVGFATEKELLETIQKKELLFAQEKLDEFKEDLGLVSKAYRHFQDAQLVLDQGTNSFRETKAELNRRINDLNDKLNIYTASNYGIDAEVQPKKYNQWLSTHQPFNWFAEFYHIVAGNGGFDCVIGNPPYVVYTEKTSVYKVLNYTTKSTSNLYAYCSERSFSLLDDNGKFGFIVPNSSISASKLFPLQKILTSKNTWVSNYSWRPAKLFEGADMLLAIIITDKSKKETLYSSQYYKWYSDYRDQLFDNISYSDVYNNLIEGSIPKMPKYHAKRILEKSSKQKNNIDNYKSDKLTKNILYYFRAVQYWFKVLDEVPIFKEDGINRVTGEMKLIHFNKNDEKNVFSSFLSSSLFFFNYITWSSCQVVNSRDFNLPFDIEYMNGDDYQILSCLGEKLQKSLQDNSKLVIRNYSKKGRNFTMEKQHFYIKKSKAIIDRIDTVLAQHYGFTQEELDFIINYDIKYRMGKTLFNEVDDEDEEE